MSRKVTVWHERPELLEGLKGSKDLETKVERIPVPRISPRAYATYVIPGSCGDCIYCEGSCPNLRMDRAIRTMTVNTVGCRGCGACLPACPSGALQVRNSYLGRIEEEVLGWLGQAPEDVPNSCNVCPIIIGDIPSVDGPGHGNIRVMCSGRFEPAQVLEALARGHDGVIVVGCLYKDFPFERNKAAVDDRLGLSRDIMGLLGLDLDRLLTIDADITDGGVGECILNLMRA